MEKRLGSFLKYDPRRFFAAIDAIIGEGVINWGETAKDPNILKVISDFKANKISKDFFISSLLYLLKIADKVSKEQCIAAWISNLGIDPDNVAAMQELKDKIAADESEYLTSDTNVIDQEYIAQAIGSADYIEMMTENGKTFAMVCGKVLIRSMDVGISSKVLVETDTNFKVAARELYNEINAELQHEQGPRIRLAM